METVEDKVEFVRGLRKTHLTTLQTNLEANAGQISAPDMLIWGALNRSMAIIDGLGLLARDGNFLCAAVLLRLQLDNLFRLYALNIVPDVNKFAIDVMEGTQIRDMKDREGKRMTDRHLVRKISKFDERFESVYDTTSGYVHLSDKHIFAPVVTKGDDGTFTVKLDGKASFDTDDERWHELVGAFIWITRNILGFVDSWNEKEQPTGGK
ncbi:MAG: hypothetical protein OXS47_08245 [Chloroflexota bacterium]|nr:hypothetical protein [Chloroflexota bacterium]